jgi:hypothetical protein
MACPDELTLDLWLAQALPLEEASTIAEHVATCTLCTASQIAWQASNAQLRAALSLNNEEQAFLASLDLSATWRTQQATATPPWGWLALIGLVAAFFAWTFAGPLVDPVLAAASRVGLGSILADGFVGVLFDAGQALFAIATSPALSLTQPLLGMLALALLLFPRAKASLQGVPS